MVNKIHLHTIDKSNYEKNRKCWDGIDMAYILFELILIYSLINIIGARVFISKWNALVPVFTYLLLLFCLSIFVMKHRNKSGDKSNWSGEEILEVIKIALAGNSVYFFCVGIQESIGDSIAVLAIHLSLYLGFAISLDKLLTVERWKDILEAFKGVMPKKQFIWPMVITCTIFGIMGICFSYTMTCLVIILIFAVSLVPICIFLLWRKKQFKLMHTQLKTRCDGKRALILHAGVNYAFYQFLKNDVEFFDVVDSLEDSIDQYDLIVVIYTFYDDAMKEIIVDNIRRTLKTDGEILDLFVGKNRGRSRLCVWLGAPMCWRKFESIDAYCKEF